VFICVFMKITGMWISKWTIEDLRCVWAVLSVGWEFSSRMDQKQEKREAYTCTHTHTHTHTHTGDSFLLKQLHCLLLLLPADIRLQDLYLLEIDLYHRISRELLILWPGILVIQLVPLLRLPTSLTEYWLVSLVLKTASVHYMNIQSLVM
jgi:hypothetical protein